MNIIPTYMDDNLPNDILNRDIEEVKSILTKKEKSDTIWAISNLFLKIVGNFAVISPELKSAADILNFIRDKYGTTASQKRQFDFLMMLFSKLIELEKKIKLEYVRKEEFELYVEKFYDSVKHEQYKDKIIAFRNASVNIATQKFSNSFEIEYFINSLIGFSDLHFAILLYFWNPTEVFKQKGIPIDDYRSQSGGDTPVLEKVFNQTHLQLVEIASKELMDKGFTETKIPFKQSLSTRSTYEKLTANYLTPLGKRFVSFCMLDD